MFGQEKHKLEQKESDLNLTDWIELYVPLGLDRLRLSLTGQRIK